ncbi:MAG: CapA family protein [Leptospiraceae bacterium]|nr:CapA family protein [Leptospiraceae bacterium]
MKKFYLIIFLLTFILTMILESGVLRKQKTVRVLVGGDVMFAWGLREIMEKKGFYSPVENLQDLFNEADLKMVNLETPVADRDEEMDKDKSYVFNAKKEELKLLQKLDIQLVFLANNHTMDYGKIGLEDTFKNLDEMKIQYVGAGNDLQEAFKPKRIEVFGQKFRITSVSATGETRLFATNKNSGAAPYDLNRILKIPNSGEVGDLDIAAVHWGREYNPEPTVQQVRDARAMIDAGYIAVVGHHPHIPTGVEKYKNGIIFYSLGNFLFGSRHQYLNHNILGLLHFQNQKLVLCELIPIFGKYQTGEHKIYPLEGKEAKDFLEEIAYLSSKLNTTVEIRNDRGYIYY